MKRKLKERKKLNNKGMSLVEILVAIVLLSIALIPLLHGFIQVTKFNVKGRELQQTTVVAQTIMENFKAYHMKGIAKKFDDGNFLSGDYANNCTYQWASNYSKFTIDKIKVDKQVYGAQILVSEVTDSKEKVLDFMNMNNKLDAVFVADSSLSTGPVGPPDMSGKKLGEFEEEIYEEVLEMIKTRVASETASNGEMIELTHEEIYESFFVTGGANNGKIAIDRKISIVSSGTDGTNTEKVKVTFEYKFSPLGTFNVNLSNGTPVATTWTEQTRSIDFEIYTNVDSQVNGGKLEKIYFFYYPAYKNVNSIERVCTSDTIVIQNNSVAGGGYKDLPVYIIKMKNNKGDTAIHNGEVAYKPTVQINNGGKIKLLSNLKVILTSPTAAPAWSESANLVNNYDCLIPNVSSKTYDLLEEKEEVLLYNITVNIFKNANFDTNMNPDTDSEKVLTLDGSKINW